MVSYNAAHMRVRRAKGSASGQVCECGRPAREWAYDIRTPDAAEYTDDRGYRYSGDPDYYVPMCFRCHRVLDKGQITHCPHGHEYTEDNTILDAGKRKCKTCVYARNRKHKPSPEQHARRMELQRIRRGVHREAPVDTP